MTDDNIRHISSMLLRRPVLLYYVHRPQSLSYYSSSYTGQTGLATFVDRQQGVRLGDTRLILTKNCDERVLFAYFGSQFQPPDITKFKGKKLIRWTFDSGIVYAHFCPREIPCPQLCLLHFWNGLTTTTSETTDLIFYEDSSVFLNEVSSSSGSQTRGSGCCDTESKFNVMCVHSLIRPTVGIWPVT